MPFKSQSSLRLPAASRFRENLLERTTLSINDENWSEAWAREHTPEAHPPASIPSIGRSSGDGNGGCGGASAIGQSTVGAPMSPILPPIRTATKNILLRPPERQDQRRSIAILAAKIT
jgi:hypothetical protein